ncbi:MAG: diacylglycerol kinase family protein [Bdellovibrionota bacterium]
MILNKNAGLLKKGEGFKPEIGAAHEITFCVCSSKKDLPPLIDRAIKRGVDVIVAGGGDGTISETVNLISVYAQKPSLGIIPLGTGNDLSRSFGIPLDPVEALNLILDEQASQGRLIDLIHVQALGETRLCVNLASGGLAGEIEKTIDDPLKQRWGQLAYARAALSVANHIKEFKVQLTIDENPALCLSTLNVIVANGKAAGGGFEVAPHASPVDHKLDVVIVHPAARMQLALTLAQLLGGDYTQSENVTHFKARKIKIDSDPQMDFNIDGDLFSPTPLEFSVIPNALRIITKKENKAPAAA